MLKFYKLTKKAINKVESFTKNSKHPFCDYSVGVLFTWFIGFKTSYAIWDETLILKVGNKNQRFLMPLGKNVNGAITEIENYCKEKGIALKFISVSDEWAEYFKLKYDGKIKCRFNRDYSDYIYDYLEIYSFSGKKFSGQRNHINGFKKLYPNYAVSKIKETPKKEIKCFLKEYLRQYSRMKGNEKREFNYTKELLKLINKSELFGIVIKVEDKIIGLSIGEYVGDMLVIHVEKALTKYKGVYPTLFNEFAKFSKKEGVNYINREDDSGDQGLRTSKTQYKPISIVNKNFIEILKF